MNWIFEEKPLDQLPEWAFGFVYMIEHLPSGRRYIGRKNHYSVRTRKMNPVETAAHKEVCPRCRKHQVTTRTESDWRRYFSSNDALKALVKSDKPANFRRTILEVAHSAKYLTYAEIKHIMQHNALEDPRYFNENIQGIIFQHELTPHADGGLSAGVTG